jgi:homoserine kinase type II
MAVYTPVSEEELKKFLSQYDIGELVSHEGIEQGVSNTNYFVTTDKDRYVLTLFEPHRVYESDIPFFLNYSITLEQAGIPCPKTLQQKDGHTLGRLCGRPAAIFSVLEGEGATIHMLSPDLCEKAGATLAKMHIASAAITSYAPNHFSLPCWRSWISSIGQAMNSIQPGLYEFARNEMSWVEKKWPEVPGGVIHADYFPDNVFFKDGKVSGVIDFHFVCNDLFAYDLAIALNAWSFDVNNTFRKDRFDALLRGYNSVRPLSLTEKNALPVLVRAAALRFLLSRIEEKLKWKPGDFMKPHDPLVFEKRLKHFQRGIV